MVIVGGFEVMAIKIVMTVIRTEMMMVTGLPKEVE